MGAVRRAARITEPDPGRAPALLRGVYEGSSTLPALFPAVVTVKCEGCGAELAEGAKTCSACGRAVSFGRRAEAETAHVAEKTGEVAGKVGRGVVGVGKSLVHGAKKGFKGSEEEQQKSS